MRLMFKRIKTLTSLTSVVKIIGHHPRFSGSWAGQNRQFPGTCGRSVSAIPRECREFAKIRILNNLSKPKFNSSELFKLVKLVKLVNLVKLVKLVNPIFYQFYQFYQLSTCQIGKVGKKSDLPTLPILPIINMSIW